MKVNARDTEKTMKKLQNADGFHSALLRDCQSLCCVIVTGERAHTKEKIFKKIKK